MPATVHPTPSLGLGSTVRFRLPFALQVLQVLRERTYQRLQINIETRICLKWQVLRHQKRC